MRSKYSFFFKFTSEIRQLASGKELYGLDYSIIVVNSTGSWVSDIWPSSLPELFYDLKANGTAASLENKRRVTFLMATADVHEVPEDLIGHLWEKSHLELTAWPAGLIELWNYGGDLDKHSAKDTTITKLNLHSIKVNVFKVCI